MAPGGFITHEDTLVGTVSEMKTACLAPRGHWYTLVGTGFKRKRGA